jgi:Tfp pilus assembly protein PilF
MTEKDQWVDITRRSSLEEAEQAIKQALENEPQNQALLTMLAQVYQQQLDLINKVHAPRWQQI